MDATSDDVVRGTQRVGPPQLIKPAHTFSPCGSRGKLRQIRGGICRAGAVDLLLEIAPKTKPLPPTSPTSNSCRLYLSLDQCSKCENVTKQMASPIYECPLFIEGPNVASMVDSCSVRTYRMIPERKVMTVTHYSSVLPTLHGGRNTGGSPLSR